MEEDSKWKFDTKYSPGEKRKKETGGDKKRTTIDSLETADMVYDHPSLLIYQKCYVSAEF